MNKPIAELKKEWHDELVLLKKRCTMIENRLQSLDDYDLSRNGKLNHAMLLTREGRANFKPDTRKGLTALERTCYALLKIPEPFTLVQLRDLTREDGLSEITHGNWGNIVQKIKKAKMIFCCEGEQGQPGALYRRVALVETK